MSFQQSGGIWFSIALPGRLGILLLVLHRLDWWACIQIGCGWRSSSGRVHKQVMKQQVALLGSGGCAWRGFPPNFQKNIVTYYYQLFLSRYRYGGHFEAWTPYRSSLMIFERSLCTSHSCIKCQNRGQLCKVLIETWTQRETVLLTVFVGVHSSNLPITFCSNPFPFLRSVCDNRQTCRHWSDFNKVLCYIKS